MRGLYAIVDVDTIVRLGADVLTVGEALLAARPAALQLRAKSLSTRDHLDLLKRLQKHADSTEVPFFANDRPDLAVLAGCTGVHVGQEDLPVAEVRRFAPRLRVGVSTHDLEQLRAALEEHPDYVAYGPVYSTVSKARPDPSVGPEGLRQAWELVRGRVPLVAIGGIDRERARELRPTCDAVAVIGALLGSGDLREVTDRARAFAEAFGG